MNTYRIYIFKGMDESNATLRAENINDARRKIIKKYLQERISEGYKGGEGAITIHVQSRYSDIGTITVNPWTNRPVWTYLDSSGAHIERDIATTTGALTGKVRKTP